MSTDLRTTRLALAGIALVLSGISCGGDDDPTAPTPKEPTQLAFTVQPTSTTAGTAINPAVEVELRDADGNRATDARNTVTLTFAANPGSGNLSGTKTVNAVNGVASFSGLFVDKAATGYTLSATSGGLTTATSAAFNIAAGPATRLTFTTQPPSTVEGNTAFAPQVTVTDAFGNVVSVATPVTLTLGVNPGGGQPVNQTVTTVDGVATFPGVRIGQPGTGYRLEAFAEGLTGATSTAFTVRVTFTGIDAGASSGGSVHTCAINAAFGVYCWGLNSNGELGDGGMVSRNTPVAAVTPAGSTFNSVSAGGRTTCAVATAPTSGDVYCWGNNNQGQLGDGTQSDRATPARVLAPTGVVFQQISGQGGHVCGVTPAPSGVVYCWGRNSNGELGDNSQTRRTTPVSVVMPTGVTFSQVTSGEHHTCALAAGTSGAVYCWGANGNGQLGDNTTLQKLVPTLVAAPTGVSFVQVEAGTFHTCARTATGAAYCWGINGNGQLGDNTTTQKIIPTAVQGGFLFSSIAAGTNHSCGIQLTTNAGYCWGWNATGQLGDGTLVQKLLPSQVTGGHTFTMIRAGNNHSCAIVSTPTAGAYCWGGNSNGELGDGTNVMRPSPTRVVQ